MYICFGRSAMFLVDDEMVGANGNGTLYSCRYRSLERCEVDTKQQELFALYFMEGTSLYEMQEQSNDEEDDQDEATFPPKMLFRCADRARLCTELEIYFRTDFMYQHWQIPLMPFVVESHDLLPLPTVRARPTVSPEYTTASLAGYQFHCPNIYDYAGGFRAGRALSGSSGRTVNVAQRQDVIDDGAFATATTVEASTIASARYVNIRGNQRSVQPLQHFMTPALEIIIHKPYPIARNYCSLTLGSAQRARDVAEQYMHLIGQEVLDYRIVGRLQRYQRRRNDAKHDLAMYNCWRLHMRTAKPRNNTQRSLYMAFRDIAIYIIQRRYIPPNMDHFQTIAILGFSRHYDHNIKAHVEHIADSFTCSTKSTSWDQLVVQTKANALMLDETSYMWYTTQLEPPVKPVAADLATLFCQSILGILVRARVQLGTAQASKKIDLQAVGPDPFEYAQRLEAQIPGGYAQELLSEQLIRGWKARVWRYLAFCVDGGLFPDDLNLDILSVAVQQHSKRLQELSQLLQTLLYLRATGEDFQKMPLLLKVVDDRLMDDFTFNEKVLQKLLHSGYIKWLLESSGDVLEYPRFLSRLLQNGRDRVRWGFDLQTLVCEHLARSSVASTMKISSSNASLGHPAYLAPPLSDLALQTIVPALIDVLNDDTCNERIQVLVVSSLVNYTRDNAVLKTKVMAGGTFRQGAIERICRFLQSKNDDLVKHSVSLLNNCTKSEQYRNQVAKFRAIESLMRLLRRNDYQPLYRPIQILTQAAAVVGNLASDVNLREQITNSLGFTKRVLEDRTAQVRLPKAIDELISLLKDTDNIFSPQPQYGSLCITVIYALRNLCIKHNSNKVHVGLMAIPTLVAIARDTSETGDVNHTLLEVTLRCIYILSFHPDNCLLLQKQEILKILQDKQSPSVAEFRVQIQRKMNDALGSSA